jgi:predicted heme/steroid binding protein
MRKIFIKLDRLAAWVLFIGIVLYLITGYGMTKGIISNEFSSNLHLDWLIYIVFIAFFIHAPYAIRLALKRWNFWNIFSKILWALIIGGIALLIIYAEFIYQKESSDSDTFSSDSRTVIEEVQSEGQDNLGADMSDSDSDVNIFTLEELSKYDGKNGNRAFVAVDGNVYDLSEVFEDGVHFSHFAGQELTNDFYKKHMLQDLDKYQIVGRLEK